MNSIWNVTSVGECLAPVTLSGKTKVLTRDYQSHGQYPVIDQGQNEVAGWTDDESSVIRSPLPIIVFGDHTRIFKYVDKPFARGADGTQLLLPKSNIDPRFFYYACRAIDLPSRGYNRHFTVLKEKEIKFPADIYEQRAITTVLRLIESVADLQARALEITSEIKRTVIHLLLTRGLHGARQKISEIGPMPESWELVTLDSVAKVRAGNSFPPALQGNVKGNFPFYKVSDMNLPGNELRMYAALNEIGMDDLKFLRARTFPAGTVIFPKVGGALHTNKKRLLTRESLADNNIMGVTTLDSTRCLPEFLFTWFQTVNLSSIANAGPLPSINGSQLYELKLPLPTLVEQQEIVEVLDVLDRKVELHRQKEQVLNTLFSALLEKLMSREISVSELDLSGILECEST